MIDSDLEWEICGFLASISSKNLQPLDKSPVGGVGRVGKLIVITLPIRMIELGQPTIAVVEE